MELVDVRADAIAPGESICLAGAVILITDVSCRRGVVDLHTEYGPALRLLASDVVAAVWSESSAFAA